MFYAVQLALNRSAKYLRVMRVGGKGRSEFENRSESQDVACGVLSKMFCDKQTHKPLMATYHFTFLFSKKSFCENDSKTVT